MMERLNCWQYMQCGRETGGENVAEFGICTAALDYRFEGINGGSCAGRFCWYVAGTFCMGKVQGTFASKIGDCLKCPFFLEVEKQEGSDLVFIKEDIHLDH